MGERCNLLFLLLSLSFLQTANSFSSITMIYGYNVGRNVSTMILDKFRLSLQRRRFTRNNYHFKNNQLILTSKRRKIDSSTTSTAFHSRNNVGLDESKNYKDNETKLNNDDEISFHWESFDSKGEWMTIDYDNIPIDNRRVNQNESKIQNVFAPLQPSPVERKLIHDKLVYIKRDDLLHLRNSNVSGNKARKMLALNELNIEDFPEVVVSYGGPQSNAMVALAAIVQSKNVELQGINNDPFKDKPTSKEMVDEIESDSWIMTDDLTDERSFDHDEDEMFDTGQSSDKSATKPRKRFMYYTKKLPRYLRNQPNGNLLRALTLGMEMIQLKPNVYNDYFGGDHGGSSVAPINAPIPGSSLWVSFNQS